MVWDCDLMAAAILRKRRLRAVAHVILECGDDLEPVLGGTALNFHSSIDNNEGLVFSKIGSIGKFGLVAAI